MTNNPDLTTIVMPNLTSAGSVNITNNPNLTTIDLGSLTTAGSVGILQRLSNDDRRGSLTTAGDVNISNNPNLTTIDLGSLTTTGSVNISNNAALSDIDLAAGGGIGGSVTISEKRAAAVHRLSVGCKLHRQGSVTESPTIRAACID